MKTIHVLCALAASLALSSAAFAGSAPREAVTSGRQAVKPVVTKVVHPERLPRSFHRKVVNVRFALDQNGQPTDIEIVSRTARAAKKQIVAAFREWRFEVAALGHDATSKRFVLPLDIIPQA